MTVPLDIEASRQAVVIFKEEEMDALLDSYLYALSHLKEEVKDNKEILQELDMLQIRLRDNFRQKIYGSAKESQADRNEILSLLNGITRNICNKSFDEYCQSFNNKSRQVERQKEEVVDPTENITIECIEPLSNVDNLPNVVQQTSSFLDIVNNYVVTLQKNVQKAREIFNNNADISQERCEDALSSFYLLDCSNFPTYNQSLFKAKVRLQHLNEQVNKLIDLCEICNDVDQHAKSAEKKIQQIMGILDSLFYDVTSVQALLNTIDVEMPT
jgi:hypothetical protein